MNLSVKPSLVIVAVLSCLVTTGAQGHGQNFSFVEETWRLPPDTTVPGTSSTDVDLVDVDSDGDLDLFIAEGTDSAAARPNRLLLNVSSGEFFDVSATYLPPAVANSTKADFGDIDGDGDLDAIVANLGPEQLLVNTGTGVFVDGSARLPPPPPFFQDITADARMADVDGDGDLDILLSNENPFDPSPTGGGQNRLLINNGLGTFADESAARFPVANDQTGAMLPGDVDADGDLDVVVLNRGQDFVLINNGSGFFDQPDVHPLSRHRRHQPRRRTGGPRWRRRSGPGRREQSQRADRAVHQRGLAYSRHVTSERYLAPARPTPASSWWTWTMTATWTCMSPTRAHSR